jgi:hypothetical protein
MRVRAASLLKLVLAAALAAPGCGPSRSGPASASRPRGRTIRVPADRRTIQAAVDAARDGDTVLVAPGVYPGGIRLAGKSITLASHFLIDGKQDHVAATILGGPEPGGEPVLRVEKDVGAGARIVGFTIRNGSDGIRCYAKIAVLHNVVTGCKDGIDYEGGGGVCRGNEFVRNRDDGIDLDGDCAVLIEKNVISDNRDDGIEIRFYPYDEKKQRLDIVVRENVISGNGEDGIQVIDHPGRSNRLLRIERNLISGTRKAAIGFMDGARTGEDYRAAAMPDPVWVIGNTFLDNHYGLTGGGNLAVVNNVFARTERTALKGAGGGVVVTHNLFWKNGRDFDKSEVRRADAIFKDPLLDERGRPRKGSPCIDAGTRTFTWKGRKVAAATPGGYSGAAPDLGAFEYRNR